jgi:condensin-2 complex subunit G2
VAKHASDKSSLAVRAGGIHAISLLLEAEESHAVLRALLPSIGNLIHDKVERVRLATMKLLLQVKKIRGIKY